MQVLKLRDILRFDVDTSVTARMALETFALKCLRYKMDDECKDSELDDKIKFYVTDEYKVLQSFSPGAVMCCCRCKNGRKWFVKCRGKCFEKCLPSSSSTLS